MAKKSLKEQTVELLDGTGRILFKGSFNSLAQGIRGDGNIEDMFQGDGAYVSDDPIERSISSSNHNIYYIMNNMQSFYVYNPTTVGRIVREDNKSKKGRVTIVDEYVVGKSIEGNSTQYINTKGERVTPLYSIYLNKKGIPSYDDYNSARFQIRPRIHCFENIDQLQEQFIHCYQESLQDGATVEQQVQAQKD